MNYHFSFVWLTLFETPGVVTTSMLFCLELSTVLKLHFEFRGTVTTFRWQFYRYRLTKALIYAIFGRLGFLMKHVGTAFGKHILAMLVFLKLLLLCLLSFQRIRPYTCFGFPYFGTSLRYYCVFWHFR